jgi:quinoprotein glucose dehydrogenase
MPLRLLLAAALAAFAADDPYATWTQYLGGPDSTQYSSLKQINKSNVRQLDVAWSYPAGDRTYLFGPIVVDGVMYVVARNNAIVALDAATGKELWIHENQGAVGARGINYWESKDRSDRRLLYLNAGFLTAIDARTGQTIMSFGDNGRTDLRVGLNRDLESVRPLQTNNPGRIFDHIIIMSLPASGASYESTAGDTHAYDVRTGRLLWVFHAIPHPGEFGYETWPPDAYKNQGGVHNWNEMTVDEKRGIVYIPFGSPRYDFYGANRPGQNLFGNTLVALDARTGKRLWHFQVIHHDLWDWDIPTAPKLLTVRHNGRNIDAIAQPTKQGFLFVFNRATGEPLWPVEERPVPQSDVPGENSWPTQPFPTRPPAFARQSFTEKDINPYIPEADQAKVREILRTYRNEGLFTPPSLRGSIQLPGHNGGANWGSSAVDPVRGLMYIVSKELPTTLRLTLPQPGQGKAKGKAKGAPDAPPPAPPPVPPPTLVTPQGQAPRYNAPIDFMLQSNGLSALSPPWSQLTAYDLNLGAIKWQVPNGSVTAIAAQGNPNTGAHFPRGGVVATASGLVFVATASDRKFRAYDADNGKVIWEKDLSAGSEGVPAVYEVGGRQFIALPVSGGGMMAPRLGAPVPPAPSAYVAFALPKK